MNKESVPLPFGIKNIPDYHRLKKFAKADEFPYSGLWLFCGAQGHGKTLTLMSVLREIVKDYPDCIVVSNIAIFGVPSFPYTGIEDFEKYHNGDKGIIYVIDEIHTLFNSLESKDMPLSTVQVWSQNRKNRRVILGTSQRFNRVAKEIREQTMLLYACKRPILWFHRFQVFDATEFDDKGNYLGEPERTQWYVPSWSALTGYNTLEVVKRNAGKIKNPAQLRSDQIEELREFLGKLEKEE